MRKLATAAVCVMLTACATAPPQVFIRADGQRSIGDPALEQQYTLDSSACVGEMAKANMSGTVIADGGLAGLSAAIERNQEASVVLRGCMAQKGYLLVPKDQVEERLQLAAAATAEAKAKAQAASEPEKSPAKKPKKAIAPTVVSPDKPPS
jgi:hypothetical protein